MRVSWTIGGSVAVEEQHEDDEEQQRAALHPDAELHQLVRTLGVAALRHVDDAEQQHAEGREHREHDEDRENSFHPLYIARPSRGAQRGSSAGLTRRQLTGGGPRLRLQENPRRRPAYATP